MDIKHRIIILSAKLSHWCSCHIKVSTPLAEMKIKDQLLADFVNELQLIYKITISPEIFTQWITVKDIIDFITNNQKI